MTVLSKYNMRFSQEEAIAISTPELNGETTPAPPSLKERQRLEREKLILDAAEAVLAEKGYLALAMEEIAARVGIARATVYLHFPSKDDLVVALFERTFAGFRQLVADALAAPGSARERLERVLIQTYSGIRSGRSHLMLALAAEPQVRASLLEKHLSHRDQMSQVHAAIQTILEDGKAAGEFNQQIPTAVMLTTFLGLLSPRSSESLLADHSFSPEELAQHVGAIFFTGITSAQPSADRTSRAQAEGSKPRDGEKDFRSL